MAGRTRQVNFPGVNNAVPQRWEKVRKLQWKLCGAAKRQKGRRFHALWQCVTDRHVLREAWRRVNCNRGACGVDGETLAAIEERGVEEYLKDLQRRLKASAEFLAQDGRVMERARGEVRGGA
jgi:hypothetical protein